MSSKIAISEGDRKTISDGLSHLLADSYTLYLKTQNYHWNVIGPMFQQLHMLFEQQYRDLADAVDEIAERIRSLGAKAPASYTEFVKLSEIQEETGSPKAEEMIKKLMQDQLTIAAVAHRMFPSVAEAGDEATADLLTRRIAIHEKNAWMLRSLLE